MFLPLVTGQAPLYLHWHPGAGGAMGPPGHWHPSQLPALGREVNGHSHRVFCSLHLYLWLESQAEITNVSYRMDSALRPTVTPLQRNA